MDLVVITQIITGSATLFVALVLAYQLRQQHKDAEVELTMQSWSLNQELMLSEIQNEKLSEILTKSKEGQNKLNPEEKEIFSKWAFLKFGRIITEWRLGRMSNDPVYYKLHLSFMNHNGVLEHFKANREGMIEGSKWKKGIVEIVDEMYLEYSGEKIGD